LESVGEWLMRMSGAGAAVPARKRERERERERERAGLLSSSESVGVGQWLTCVSGAGAGERAVPAVGVHPAEAGERRRGGDGTRERGGGRERERAWENDWRVFPLQAQAQKFQQSGYIP
jgi:hypothetical protein